MSTLSAVLSTCVGRRRKFGEVSCTQCIGLKNDIELISTVVLVVNFRRSVIIAKLWWPEVAKS